MIDPVLVTGAAGFAGSHLVEALVADGVRVIAWHRPGAVPPGLRHAEAAPVVQGGGARVAWTPVDVLDRDAVAAALAEARPAAIFHCAGSAHVGSSWQDSLTPLETNALGTHHLFDGVRRAGLRCRVVVACSALVYRPSLEALDEEAPLAPSNPYGLSKLAQEMLSIRAAAAGGLDVVVARAFNHAGPRQDPSYATAGFARQIALAEADRAAPLIEVGNLDARRDITDVRDTVHAYRALAARGAAGRPYNVCCGRAYAVRELLDRLLAGARVRLQVRVDETRLRPHDIPVLLGDPSRIARETGWQAEIPIERTLRDLLEYWRRRVGAGEEHRAGAPEERAGKAEDADTAKTQTPLSRRRL
jgi:GDP-4-dehydro-6-deoxy-D-mannose reductase